MWSLGRAPHTRNLGDAAIGATKRVIGTSCCSLGKSHREQTSKENHAVDAEEQLMALSGQSLSHGQSGELGQD